MRVTIVENGVVVESITEIIIVMDADIARIAWSTSDQMVHERAYISEPG